MTGDLAIDPAAEVNDSPAATARFPDLDWFIAHFEELLDAYPDQWLVISNQQVVAHALSAADLRHQIQALGIRQPFIARTHPGAWANLK